MMDYLLEKPVVANIGTEKYRVTIEWRNGLIIGDEPEKIGGKDLGPDPYTLLLSSLASCTLSTLRMYIDRKGWEIPQISVSLNMLQSNENGLMTQFERQITFSDNIPDDIKDRLLIIAKKCPVSKILENSITINTQLK